jgi:hypothetical protein
MAEQEISADASGGMIPPSPEETPEKETSTGNNEKTDEGKALLPAPIDGNPEEPKTDLRGKTEKSKQASKQNLEKAHAAYGRKLERRARALIVAFNIAKARHQRLFIDSYAAARNDYAAIMRAVASGEVTPAAGAVLVQCVRGAVAALEAEQRRPSEEDVNVKYELVLDESAGTEYPPEEAEESGDSENDGQGPAKA